MGQVVQNMTRQDEIKDNGGHLVESTSDVLPDRGLESDKHCRSHTRPCVLDLVGCSHPTLVETRDFEDSGCHGIQVAMAHTMLR